LTEIGEYAFYSCDLLAKLSVSENNKKFSSENNALYNKDKTTLIFYPRSASPTLIVADSVRTIQTNALRSCTQLTNITIPATVELIQDSAFHQCDVLKNVYIYGTEAEWSLVKIEGNNTPFVNAAKHFINPTSKQPILMSRNILGGKSVTITTADDDTVIYYTTDGSNPTVNSTVYSSPIEFTEAGEYTVKAISVTKSYEASEIKTETVTVTRAQAPVANVSSGFVSSGTEIKLVSDIEGANIYYTVDGTVPDRDSEKFVDGIVINENVKIKAIVIAEGYAESEICEFEYTIDLIDTDTSYTVVENNYQISVTPAKLIEGMQIIVALYDNEDRVVEVKKVDMSLEQYQTAISKGNDDKYFKVYVWNKNMVPISNYEKIEIQ